MAGARDPISSRSKRPKTRARPLRGKSKISNQGQRVVEGQRLMQAASDITLGHFAPWAWTDVNAISIYAAGTGSRVDPATLPQLPWPSTAGSASRPWPGRTPLRRPDRHRLVLGAGPTFDTAIGNFAVAYADQNERDYEMFLKAVKGGTLMAEAGIEGTALFG